MNHSSRPVGAVVLAAAMLAGLSGCGSAPKSEPAAGMVPDQDVNDAYVYLLGRLLVLRQEQLDFQQDGFQWNQILHRDVGGASWANPNLDVAYSEAWIAVDEKTCAVVNVPRIKGRYYTVQFLNGWGRQSPTSTNATIPAIPAAILRCA
ncbi:DUF1254 domain-containing protein [Cupriavidus basilensis]